MDDALAFAPRTQQQLLSVTSHFAAFQRLTVRQRKRWLEILTSFEAKNSYDVFDEQSVPRLHVRELGSGFASLLKRIFLGPARPFDAEVTDTRSGAVLLRLRRPWRWIYHRLEVRDDQSRLLGVIEKEWSWVRRIYRIEGPTGGSLAQLFGPMLKPWTFEIRIGAELVGTVQKRWSGLGKEMFTDADNFGIDLGTIKDPLLKTLCFAAVVLIDIVHFEKTK